MKQKRRRTNEEKSKEEDKKPEEISKKIFLSKKEKKKIKVFQKEATKTFILKEKMLKGKNEKRNFRKERKLFFHRTINEVEKGRNISWVNFSKRVVKKDTFEKEKQVMKKEK